MRTKRAFPGRSWPRGPGHYNPNVRVLICRLSSFGDVIHAWPVAVSLAAAGHEVGWVVEAPLAPLVRPHPAVASVIEAATARWRRRPFRSDTRTEVRSTVSALRRFRAEVAIDLQGLLKSALLARLSGAPERIGPARAARRELLAGLAYTRVFEAPAGVVHIVDVNLSSLSALGIEPSYGARPDGGFLRRGAGDRPRLDLPDTPFVALFPGAGAPGKAWPPERIAGLAHGIGGLGLVPLLVWGPGELDLARSIAGAGGCAVAPETDIPGLALLLDQAAAAVGPDSGPVHLAAALGVPTVAIHTVTDPARNGPRGERVRIVEGARVGATRGRARTGPARAVPPEEVLAAVRSLLGGPPR